MNGASTYEAVEAYLLATISEALSPRTSYKLDRIRALLHALGDPHLAYPTVHVGGTSGKGSTSTMIAAALTASGKRTGLHTKPHLRAMTERARIDGAAVSRERFARLFDEMRPALERTAAAFGRPTYYETLLALAFLHFARERVDVAAIEVGLGGRLDGTNVVRPEVAAITSIGFDHMAVLGDTLEAIAAEKAGIAKPGIPLVVAPVPAPAMETILAHAAAAGAPVVAAGAASRIENVARDGAGQRFDVVTRDDRYRIRTPLRGAFQRTNAATAIVALEMLSPALRPSRAAVEAAFAGIEIPGRMDVVAHDPALVLDIAHNAEKAAGLVEALREEFGARPMHVVAAIGDGKDAREVLRALAGLPAAFSFTAFAAEGRAAIAPAALREIARSLDPARFAQAPVFDEPLDAVEAALREAGPGGVVVVTGSTFVVANVREWWTRAAVR